MPIIGREPPGPTVSSGDVAPDHLCESDYESDAGSPYSDNSCSIEEFSDLMLVLIDKWIILTF